MYGIIGTWQYGYNMVFFVKYVFYRTLPPTFASTIIAKRNLGRALV